MPEPAEVPDLVGLTVRIARRIGHENGFVVIGPDADGPPLGALTWPGTWIVTSQDPAAGTRLVRGERVVVRFRQEPGGGTAGVREPRRPSPSPLSAREEAEVEAETSTEAAETPAEVETEAGGASAERAAGTTGGSGMSLHDRLSGILRRELGLLHELRKAREELAVVQDRVRIRLADLEHQANVAEEHYRQALDEGDPQAGLLRDWPVRIRARIEELMAAASDLEATEASIVERIRHAERDIEDFRVLQPQIIARVAAARTAGLGREVFETLSDALSYVEIALAAAKPDEGNGALSAERVRPPERSGDVGDEADQPESITATEP